MNLKMFAFVLVLGALVGVTNKKVEAQKRTDSQNQMQEEINNSRILVSVLLYSLEDKNESKSFVCRLNETETVRYFLRGICRHNKLPTSSYIALLYKGSQMHLDVTLKDCGVANNDRVVACYAAPGRLTSYHINDAWKSALEMNELLHEELMASLRGTDLRFHRYVDNPLRRGGRRLAREVRRVVDGLDGGTPRNEEIPLTEMILQKPEGPFTDPLPSFW